MGTINVNPDALRAHAGVCEGLAADLGIGTAPPCVDGSFQATATAVAALHASFASARSAMVNRMASTAAAFHASADGFEAREQNSAVRLRPRTQ